MVSPDSYSQNGWSRCVLGLSQQQQFFSKNYCKSVVYQYGIQYLERLCPQPPHPPLQSRLPVLVPEVNDAENRKRHFPNLINWSASILSGKVGCLPQSLVSKVRQQSSPRFISWKSYLAATLIITTLVSACLIPPAVISIRIH